MFYNIRIWLKYDVKPWLVRKYEHAMIGLARRLPCDLRKWVVITAHADVMHAKPTREASEITCFEATEVIGNCR